MDAVQLLSALHLPSMSLITWASSLEGKALPLSVRIASAPDERGMSAVLHCGYERLDFASHL
jgi:hypothetical protein